ncbi:hypothetical protein [Flavobacterium psychrotolerans]|uniref:DUF2157 domain-containing protein n=1 Tax=Flavobacterium psychrotolerans TaxID=2169410 RepID=A0A2U1JLY0_9FLAO|nr:hypothetical protein [Flavobacterium psychrotolerans]PWA05883.1 hypothetical protein DB895_05530 [Flavobacterium psychrotolerans]
MIAYDKTLLDNTYLVEEANNLKKSGFIDSAQCKTITDNLPTLNSQNNLLIRFGLFLLGCLLYSSICGMISLFAISFGQDTYKILIYCFSFIGIAGLEFMSRQNKQLGYGLDDAFLLGAQMLFFVAIGISTNENYLAVFITIAIVSTISYLRYLHLSSALLACIGITGSVAYLMFELGTLGKSILPFVMIVFSVLLYFLSEKALPRLKFPYYSKGIQLANGFSLILFYLSGNYLVVRELSILLLNNSIPATQEIPFAYFFYTFSFIIPVFYLIYSLYIKEKQMLWIGFLALGFSIYTIRYYYHILPVEVALTVGGLILFAFAYFSIQRIKHKENEITFLPDRFSNSNSLFNTELLMVTAQFGIKPEVETETSPMEFGGGGYSGGGSEGTF